MADSNLIWKKDEVPEDLAGMLETIGEEYPLKSSGTGLELVFKKAGSGLSIKREQGRAIVFYGRVSDAARAVGILLSDSSPGGNFSFEERIQFKTFGLMLDCSRNAVFKVEYLKKFLRRIALMGYNMVMLYTEDTYALPGEDYFGYLRGRYNMDELKETDEYASRLGIEMIGCIQTLGHLKAALKWPVYEKVMDTPSVLLASAEETLRFVGKMLDFFSEAFSSRRIHIGMDEAHDMGRGRYMDLNGYLPGFDIFKEHLEKLAEQCARRGMRPMIWSDMYFRLGSKEGDYYDPESVIPDGVAQTIPREIQLVYWDYYHEDEGFYREWIRRHKEMGFPPVMASGVWTWQKFWYDHATTDSTMTPCIKACIEEGVDEFFLTMWGDNGAYCDFNSALAGLCYAAERAYTAGSPDDNTLQKRFEAICGGDYKAHITASGIEAEGFDRCSPETFLWDDPILGIYWKNQKQKFPRFWQEVLENFAGIEAEIAGCDHGECGNFPHLLNILRCVRSKIILKSALDDAYTVRDRDQLGKTREFVGTCAEAFQDLSASFRDLWYENRKPHGFEVIQIRLAGQGARLKELDERLGELIAGKVGSIPELEETAKPISLGRKGYIFFAANQSL